MKKTVLVTGGAGYVGSVTARYLLASGYRVIVVDRLTFGGDSIVELMSNRDFIFHRLDLQDHEAVASLLQAEPVFAVLHLAAIVGDPACRLNPVEARRTNWDASINLFECCRRHEVERFVFASTCSNYGRMKNSEQFVDEQSDLSPISLYAELKVDFEEYILDVGYDAREIAATALRFSTVYGLSPRMRFDLTVNEFTRDMAVGTGIQVYGQEFWRPYCHVADFARAYKIVLEAPRNLVANEAFNVGDTSENYTKSMLVGRLQKLFPNAPVAYVELAEDPRDYRVNSDKIQRQLGFQISRRVPDGIQEIASALRLKLISNPYAAKYHNIPTNESG